MWKKVIVAVALGGAPSVGLANICEFSLSGNTSSLPTILRDRVQWRSSLGANVTAAQTYLDGLEPDATVDVLKVNEILGGVVAHLDVYIEKSGLRYVKIRSNQNEIFESGEYRLVNLKELGLSRSDKKSIQLFAVAAALKNVDLGDGFRAAVTSGVHPDAQTTSVVEKIYTSADSSKNRVIYRVAPSTVSRTRIKDLGLDYSNHFTSADSASSVPFHQYLHVRLEKGSHSDMSFTLLSGEGSQYDQLTFKFSEIGQLQELKVTSSRPEKNPAPANEAAQILAKIRKRPHQSSTFSGDSKEALILFKSTFGHDREHARIEPLYEVMAQILKAATDNQVLSLSSLVPSED